MFLVVSIPTLIGRKFITSSSNINSAIFNARQRRQNTSTAVAIENERLSSKYNCSNCMISMHFKLSAYKRHCKNKALVSEIQIVKTN